MILNELLEDITIVLERHSHVWLRGGHATARIIRHPRMTECLRIDVVYLEPASVGVRFLPGRAFAGLHQSHTALADVLRAAILVEAGNPSAGCKHCGKAGDPALVEGVCRRCEAYPGVR